MKKLAKILVILAALAGAAVFILPFFVHADPIKDLLVQKVEAATGRKLIFKGDAQISLLPKPHIRFADVFLENLPEASSENMVRIEEIRFEIEPSTLFDPQPTVSQVKIKHPSLQLETLSDGRRNWDFGSRPAPQMLALPPVTITDGEILYTDSRSNLQERLDGIGLEITPGGVEQVAGKVAFIYKTQPYALEFSSSLQSGEAPRPLKFQLSQEKSQLTFDGTVTPAKDTLGLQGALSLTTENAWPWLDLVWPGAFEKLPQHASAKPFKLNMDVAKSKDEVTFKNLALESTGTKAAGEVVLALATRPKITAHLNFAALDLDFLLSASAEASGAEKSAAEASGAEKSAAEVESADIAANPLAPSPGRKMTLPRNIGVTLELTAADITYRQRHITKAILSAEMQDGEIVINQAAALFPGESQLLSFGIAKETAQGVAFEGNLEAQGQDLRALLTTFGIPVSLLPQEDFRRFSSKANVYYSPVEARLSEARLLLEKVQMTGGFIFHFDPRLKVDGALGVKGLNFDHIWAAWEEYKKTHGSLEERADVTAAGARKPNFSLLKQLQADLNINARIDGFILKEKIGQSLSFHMVAKPGKAVFDKVNFLYEETDAKGSFGVDATPETPFLRTDLTIGDFDTNLLPRAEAKSANPDENLITLDRGAKWSKKQLDYPFLRYFNGDLTLAFKHLRHEALQMQDVALRGKLQDGILNLQSFQCGIWGGKLDLTGNINGGTVPGISLNLSLSNADLAQFLKNVSQIQNVNGRFGISGTLAASGINYYSWATSASGNLAVAGQNIGVNGFDLAGIIQAVSAVRSVADIVNVARLALPGGRTEFASVNGTVFIESGIMKTVAMLLESEFSKGKLSGNLALPDWQINAVTAFPLTTLDAQNPPSIQITLTGPVDKPEVALDTRLLEAYVTRRSAEKILQGPPPAEAAPAIAPAPEPVPQPAPALPLPALPPLPPP